MDQPSDERLRLAVGQLRLPVGENDPAEVLSPRPVLRECLGDTGMQMRTMVDAAVDDAEVVGRAFGNVSAAAARISSMMST
jgi:hypothetical protein